MTRRRVAAQSRLFATQKVSTGKRKGLEEQLAAAGFPPPETEFRFAKQIIDRNWAADYAWPDLRILFEVEGGAFGRYIVVTSGYERRGGRSIPLEPGTVIRAGGRHNTGAGLEQDAEKYAWASILGYIVVRATTRQIRDGIAITLLREAFRARGVELPAPPQQEGAPHAEVPW